MFSLERTAEAIKEMHPGITDQNLILKMEQDLLTGIWQTRNLLIRTVQNHKFIPTIRILIAIKVLKLLYDSVEEIAIAPTWDARP
jgi:hypothetical protein